MKQRWWLWGLAAALVVAFLSPLASSSPDGLERVAEDQSFLSAARDAVFNVIPDYAFPGVSNEALATILAGVIGTLILFGGMNLLAHVLAKGRGSVNE